MQYYRLKYRLGIVHSATNKEENKHNHIIEVEVYAHPNNTEFVEFGDMEPMVDDTLKIYQNQYLNAFEEFGGDTSIENIGEVFFEKLYRIFDANNWELMRFEIGENPLRIYSISTAQMH